MAPLVDDGPTGCPACGKEHCTSHGYEPLDPRRPVPRKQGPGWDPNDPTAPRDAKAEDPKGDKMVRGPKRDKALRPHRNKGKVRTGTPPPAPEKKG